MREFMGDCEHGLIVSLLEKRFPERHFDLAMPRALSQDELAYEAEVSRSYLSQLEKGAFYASLKIVSKLAAVLDVEPAELLKSPLKRSASGKYR